MLSLMGRLSPRDMSAEFPVRVPVCEALPVSASEEIARAAARNSVVVLVVHVLFLRASRFAMNAILGMSRQRSVAIVLGWLPV